MIITDKFLPFLIVYVPVIVGLIKVAHELDAILHVLSLTYEIFVKMIEMLI